MTHRASRSFRSNAFRLLTGKGGRSIAGLALCCLLFATGCQTSDDATAAAAQMSMTAKSLAHYYAAFGEIMKRTDRLYVIQEAMLSIPYLDADKKQVADAVAEIAMREKLADDLSRLAASFTNLADPASVKAANDSAVKLDTELETFKQTAPASAEIDAITTAIQFVVKAVQEHKEREAAKGMSNALAGLDGLFKKEMRPNESLDALYINLAESLATNLVDRGQVDESSFIEDTLGPFNMKLNVTAPDLKARIDVLVNKHVHARAEAQKLAFGNATTAMEQALDEMSHRVDHVGDGKAMSMRMAPISLADVERWAAQQPTDASSTR